MIEIEQRMENSGMELPQREPGPLLLDRYPPDWKPRPYRIIEIDPCTPTIGAMVRGVDLSLPLAEATFAELDHALLEWKVLFFQDQQISEAARAAFAARWGPLFDDQLVPSHRENPVDNLVVFGRDAVTKGVENEWHCDGSFRSEPPMGTILRAIEVPQMGGDTLFADIAVAYDNLPGPLKQQIDGLTAVHDWSIGTYASKYADRLDELRDAVRSETGL